MSERRPSGSDRPDRHPVFVYGGPATIAKGVKEVPAWYAKYQPQPQQGGQPQQAPPDTLASPAPTPTASYATNRPSSSSTAEEVRPRHASTGSIDLAPSSPISDTSDAAGGQSRSRRSSSGGSTSNMNSNIFPSLRPDPSAPRPSVAGGGAGSGARRDSMGRLFTGLTTQKREAAAGDERRESWNEQRTVMGGGVSRMVGGWWDGWLKGSGSGSPSAGRRGSSGGSAEGK